MEVNPDSIGVFGKKVPPEQPLLNGDRVEIYRPLIADPKESRRQRAKK
jgi:putative ubiquitin-RnfH superfamily antitoxin RatB of RatAB toxin-antitoxin module